MKQQKFVEHRQIKYHDVTFNYQMVCSNRKSYGIQIQENGDIIVRCPLKVSEKFLAKILVEKEQWIKETVLKQQNRHAEKPKSNLDLIQRQALEKRYRKGAKTYIPQRVEHYLTLTGGHYERIAIREQKTRWGSCSSNGTLSFNWKLMLAPPKVLDYVVVHELCHLTHMNHSKEFWNKVESILPDYREQKKWLKENGSKLVL